MRNLKSHSVVLVVIVAALLSGSAFAAGPSEVFQAVSTATPPANAPGSPPDIGADFTPYTSLDGAVSLSYPAGWAVVADDGTTMAILSDEALFEPLFMGEDFSQPAGFIVGEIDSASKYGSDDPATMLKLWAEDSDMKLVPAGDPIEAQNGAVRQVTRDYIGGNDEQILYLTITILVDDGRAGIFIGGRTGSASEEFGALAKATLGTIEMHPAGAASGPTTESLSTPTPAAAAVEDVTKRQIVFASDRDGNSEIYKVTADGTGLTRLTDDPAFDGQPVWSPDGSQILFVSKRDGDTDIYSMKPDGSEVIRLTDDPAVDHSPAWSPNGELIAFISERGGTPDVYLMRADGSEQTPFIVGKGNEMTPAWSYTTAELAFVSDQSGEFDVYVSDAAGKVRLLTKGLGQTFTPVGRQMAGSLLLRAASPSTTISSSSSRTAPGLDRSPAAMQRCHA